MKFYNITSLIILIILVLSSATCGLKFLFPRVICKDGKCKTECRSAGGVYGCNPKKGEIP
ncbi:hypothetical protein LguiB_013393 [Lonicera macranthoides]